MAPAPLSAPATVSRLRALRDAGVLTDAQLDRALDVAAEPPHRADQAKFAARAALILGALLSLASVVFFIAHNWEGMSRWARFGILEAGLVAFGVAALKARAELARQLALTACAVLIGPLLAVYGQTYQTGADPYELFLSWALLAAPLAALSRFTPLWLGTWGLLNVSASLWTWQVQPFGDHPWLYAAFVHLVVNAIGLAAYELVSRRTTWLGARAPWAARALATAALLPALPIAFWWLSGDSLPWIGRAGLWGGISSAAIAGLVGVVALVHRHDRYMKTAAAFALCGLITPLAWNALQVERYDNHWAWLGLGFFIVLEITLAISWVRRTEVIS